MSTLDMGVAAGAALAGLVAILWLRSLLKRRLGGKADGAARAPANGADAPLIERRVSAVERAQAEIVGRLDDMAETGAPEERMQAMASSLVGLIRDKNAAMETALAGLDQLRARLGTLEKIGDMAEARALFDGMAERLDALETGRKEAEAAFGARLAALSERLEGDGGPAAALAARLEKLHERKDAGLAATMARIEPLETRLGRIETAMKALPAEAAERVEGRIGEIARLQSDVQAELAALRARADSAPAPFAEISEQLTRLYAQKDSTTEAMLARLAPLEAKLAELETGLRDADPRAALDRFAERLAESETRLSGEIETLKSAENPFAEISDQLTRLYAQKDSTTEAMLARLAPLEAKLAELETGLRAADPRAALDRFAERLAASEAAHGADHARLVGRDRDAEGGGEPVRGDLGSADASLRAEGFDDRGDAGASGAAGGEAGGARDRPARRRPARGAGPVRGASGGERDAALRRDRDAEGGGEPLRGDLGSADASLRPEGFDDRGDAGASGAAGGEAGGAGDRPARRPTRARRSTGSRSVWRKARRGSQARSRR